MDTKNCPECGEIVDNDSIYETSDSFDDNTFGALILIGSCYNEDCDAIGEVALGYAN